MDMILLMIDNSIGSVLIKVMHTRAFNIHAKYVIHAAGPRWSDYRDKNECFLLLANTFLNVLTHAQFYLEDVKSIGIPLISSGIFEVPRDLCAQALYKAIDEFSQRKDLTVRSIKLVNIDSEATQALLKCFKNAQAGQEKNTLIENSINKPKTESTLTPDKETTPKTVSLPDENHSSDPYDCENDEEKDEKSSTQKEE